MHVFDRRQFLELAALAGAGIAGAVCSWTLRPPRAVGAKPAGDDFVFLQMSDTHWGFTGPAVNPHAATTLPDTVAAVNRLTQPPDFIVFTGDLTHTTDDDGERRARMRRFREIVAGLKVPVVRFMPGEHDAGLDNGAAFKELFGRTHDAFVHKGVQFIALDNVSDPSGALGKSQIDWVGDVLHGLDRDMPLAVLAHRPLFDLYPEWDWFTRDGAEVLKLFEPFSAVTVFYGHIHQEHHHRTGRIAHHAATSLMFPLPAPGSVAKKAPLPWDAGHPFRGLGFRTVQAHDRTAALTEWPLQES